MLESLDVHNLALVEQASIDFYPGLNVISGETGAGKSLLIAALCLVLGDRPRTFSQINNDKEKKVEQKQGDIRVGAIFDPNKNSAATNWLANNDLAQENSCHMRRRIVSGRSRAFINGVAVGVHELQQLGDMLVTLHSQHQHHALLDRRYQKQQLDQVAGTSALASQVQQTWQQYIKLCKQSEQADANEALARRELSFAQHNLAELDSFTPVPGEYQELDQRHRQIHRMRDIILLIEKATSALDGDINQAGISATLQKLYQEFDALYLDSTKTITQNLAQACEVIAELQHQLQQLANSSDTLDFEQNALSQIEQRLSDYHQLARKHNCKPHELPQVHAQCQQQVEKLAGNIVSKQDVQLAITQHQQQLIALADKLSLRRKEAAKSICDRVNTLLPQLAMDTARFSIHLTRTTSLPTSEGWEQPEFLLQTNVGGTLAPLKAIASGGELSRCSLAIYLACIQGSDPITMIFDEVDVGLSGDAAFAIGNILKKLSKRHQVICITHQAQICAFADEHFLVSKYRNTQKTSVQVAHLSNQESVHEIARMLSGNNNQHTDTASMVLAKQMRQRALEQTASSCE